MHTEKTLRSSGCVSPTDEWVWRAHGARHPRTLSGSERGAGGGGPTVDAVIASCYRSSIARGAGVHSHRRGHLLLLSLTLPAARVTCHRAVGRSFSDARGLLIGGSVHRASVGVGKSSSAFKSTKSTREP